MRRIATTACVLLSTLAQSSAAELDAHQLLQRGIALHREAAYAASVAALELARSQRVLSPAETVECGFYLGADYVALGSTQAARRELRAVIDSDPAYELPQYTSPKVAALFRDVRDEAERAPRLRALPPKRTAPNRVALAFEPSRTGGAAFGAARWRWRGERDFREAPLAHAGENLVADVTLDRDGMLEYFAEARGPTGPAQAASSTRPLELAIRGVPPPPPPPRPTPVWRKWWLWTAVGAVCATGLGVGLYYGLRPAPPPATGDAVLTFGVR